MEKRNSSCSAPARNDRVDGLKAEVSVDTKKKTKKSVLKFTGKYGQGYDGCGTHTHK
jgi:hypothetical protein